MRDEAIADALEHVDRHGDVDSRPSHHPASVAMRAHVVGSNLAEYDPDRDRYVLTNAGRQRVARLRSPPRPAVVTAFRRTHPRKQGA